MPEACHASLLTVARSHIALTGGARVPERGAPAAMARGDDRHDPRVREAAGQQAGQAGPVRRAETTCTARRQLPAAHWRRVRSALPRRLCARADRLADSNSARTSSWSCACVVVCALGPLGGVALPFQEFFFFRISRNFFLLFSFYL